MQIDVLIVAAWTIGAAAAVSYAGQTPYTAGDVVGGFLWPLVIVFCVLLVAWHLFWESIVDYA